MIIVLTGIDGSGKSRAARALVDSARSRGGEALLLGNYAGRRLMSAWSDRTGIRLPVRLMDALETCVRIANVLLSHYRASRHQGLVVMDRHLHCQLALRGARGLKRGKLIPWLLRVLPAPDLILYLDVQPGTASQRITTRGTDSESLADLIALRAAYRQLPEYQGFTVVDANGQAKDVEARLSGLVAEAQLQTGPDRREHQLL